jgi:hypothetical protein
MNSIALGNEELIHIEMECDADVPHRLQDKFLATNGLYLS